MEITGLNFDQKPKKHIILRSIGQSNDMQFEKAYHYRGRRPGKWYGITKNRNTRALFWQKKRDIL